ncbi:MAG: hypothetical protein KGM98_15970, partial [Bacteroidota bacterium]|nr:hypothetical protein [Bacteroidota bacterium]
PKMLSEPEGGRLFLDPRLPMLNRTVHAFYSPGSTFKTLQALIGLQEGVITTSTRFLCTGAFYGCGKPMGCLDPGNFNLKEAIAVSCNTYFANVMQRVIDNPKYETADSSLMVWDRFMYGFGLGHKLGVDIPTEIGGLIPTPRTYDRIYGKGHWNFCSFKSVSIGQGEVNVTPLQVANEMAYLANKGWYITPHLVDSIQGGDKYGLLDSFKTRHHPLSIPDTLFEAVHDGMQDVMETGTGAAAKVPGITVCGKTGTVENYYRGVKQKSHAFFAAFAPREDPKIAIAVICENAGFGANSSAPIASLMIEQYLRDSITEPDRKALIEKLAALNLMPARIDEALRQRDSILRARTREKDSSFANERRYLKILTDTIGIDEQDDSTTLQKVRSMEDGEDSPKPKPATGAPKAPAGNIHHKAAATLPERPRIKTSTPSTK